MTGNIIYDLPSWAKDIARRVELLERRRSHRGTGGTGGGTTDHGLLTGLGDDDHAQYHTDARGDVRYSRTTHNHDAAYLAPAEVLAGANITVDRTTTPGSVIIGAAIGGGTVFYKHTQSVLSQNWTVNHNLGWHPAVGVEDAAGHVMVGSVTHTSDTSLTIHFAMSITGTVYCT